MKNSTASSSRRPLLAMVASAACLFTVASPEAMAWEAATTHAGLTEQAALAADLHRRLNEQFGAQNGLYSQLTVPQADAPGLFDILRRLNPTHGYVPNAKGKMTAMAWLAAGSVVADVPGESASNHFLDPRSGHGLSGKHAGGAGHKLCRAVTGLKQAAQITPGGEPANAWWKSPANSMGYVGFLDQFRKAVRSTSQAERDRHLAGALLAAGAMLHVLQDMGSPDHVRNDLAALHKRVSPNYYDRGSRFERIAALAFGRLGVPGASAQPTLPTLDSHFSNAASTGLADIIESSYFSNSTLPGATKVYRDAGASVFREAIVKRLKRPEPSPHSRLDIVAARNHEGATWRNESGVCLTRYRLRRAKVTFWIDDDCALEQVEAILPAVTAYSSSFLQALFPDDLSLTKEAGKLVVKMDEKRYGEGNLTFFADAADGTRSEYFASATGQGAAAETSVPLPPRTATGVTVLFDGRDALGQPLLAARSYPWPFAKTTRP